MRRTPTLLLTAGLLLVCARVQAQDDAVAYALGTGQAAPWLGPSQPGRAMFLVRFDPGIEPLDSVLSLANRGVSIAAAGPQPLVWREWALVRANAAGVQALRALPGLRSLRALPPPGLPPLDRSAEHLGLQGAWGARPNERWTGSGVLIANVDSHVDVFHPDFFFADAGWYDWLDVDGDGVFTPNVDAIDLDRDGVADDDERARVLRASPIDFNGAHTGSLTRPRFDPSVDWIYVDVDGDGERGFGAPRYTDADPAFGEPLFVPDDVNGNGRLDPEERLVRLGTSKLRAVLVKVDYPGLPLHDWVYERGTDLSEAPRDVTGGIYGYADTLHASGVLGILAGGVPLPSRRWVGIAPDAELVNAFDLSSNGASFVFALHHNPDVLLHEYVTWTDVALDGSDPFSDIIEYAANQGIANICPVGNIGGADRHAQRAVSAGTEESLELTIPEGVSLLQLALHARGSGKLSATLIASDGSEHVLGEAYTETPLGGSTVLYSYGETSPRDTQMRFATITVPPAGSLSIRIRAEDGPLEVHAMSADDYGFARGAAWLGASDASTVAAPATADACLAVGAIPSHLASEGPWFQGFSEQAHEVRAYSARGPRIDGALRPHVVAPDNPWAPLGVGPIFPGYDLRAPHGAYMVFSGTSGAGPHVAGIAALLAESGLEGEAILARIRDSALVDPIAGTLPNNAYGHGRISAVDALEGRMSAPPTVQLRAEPPMAAPGQPVQLIVEASDPDGGPVQIRWDDDYDGSWDSNYGPVEARTVTLPKPGVLRYRVRARDETGAIADAALKLIITDASSLDGGVNQADGGMSEPTSGGCGCGVAGSSSGIGIAPVALAVLLWRRARRRRSVVFRVA